MRSPGAGGTAPGGAPAGHGVPESLRAEVSVWRHPSRLMAVSLAALVVAGTLLLRLPAASAGPGSAPLRTALFTSTAAASMTNLNVVDPGTYWSPFGQVVIMVLIQVGGIGVMASATLVAILVAARMGLRSRLVGESDTHAMSLSTVRRVLVGTVTLAAVTELLVTVVLALRLWLGHGYPFGRAVWFGLFHAVSAFDNAGFSLWSGNLARFSTDPLVVVPIALAAVVGGLGFLVVFELTLVRPVRRWTVHTKTTLAATAALLVAGPVAVLAGEWGNPRTLGALDVPGRVLAGIMGGITPRTAGFSTFDYGHARAGSRLFTEVLMFVGGGSGSTAGGIKVTTFAVLVMAVVAEARGDRDVDMFRRRMSASTVRQAIAVAALGAAVLLAGTMAVLATTDLPLDDVLFEVTSALANVGLSTGITPHLPPAAQYLLMALMYLGRIGSIALVTSLAMRSARRSYRNPEGRPMVG